MMNCCTTDSYTQRLAVFKDFVLNLADLSKCSERHVAAIITDKELSQVYSIGINGGPKGLMNCMCNMPGKYGCVHAEINALIKCRSDTENKVMIVSLSPCIACAAAIINAPGSFSKVYFIYDWKDNPGAKLLTEAGIPVVQI